MSLHDGTPNSVSSIRQRARRLRMTGVGFLVSGMIIAGVVYWLGTRSPDVADDSSMLRYDRPAERQMETLYGKQGDLIEEWSNDLKQPGTQAVIIILTAALVTGCCFYFARLLDYDADHADGT